MAVVSVAQAAERLGVSVPRIHQRIADGSLLAERIGSQWVVDERSLLRVQERNKAGRPYSARSAWAIIAASEAVRAQVGGNSVPARVKMQLGRLLEPSFVPAGDEEAIGARAASLRSVFRKRAERRLLRASRADLADLRVDVRWAMVVEPGASGIASADVEGYLGESQVDDVVRDYLLVDADGDANVVAHVIPDQQHPYPDSRLRLAADLAEHRGPREEARAAELLHELAMEWKAAQR